MLVYRRAAVLVVRDQRVKPAAELVFLLDDVVGDGAPAVLLGLLPPQGHRLVVESTILGSRSACVCMGSLQRIWISSEDWF